MWGAVTNGVPDHRRETTTSSIRPPTVDPAPARALPSRSACRHGTVSRNATAGATFWRSPDARPRRAAPHAPRPPAGHDGPVAGPGRLADGARPRGGVVQLARPAGRALAAVRRPR